MAGVARAGAVARALGLRARGLLRLERRALSEDHHVPIIKLLKDAGAKEVRDDSLLKYL